MEACLQDLGLGEMGNRLIYFRKWVIIFCYKIMFACICYPSFLTSKNRTEKGIEQYEMIKRRTYSGS